MKNKNDSIRHQIKTIKLAFYDQANEENKKQYLNHYFEAFPSFKEKYIKADEKNKQILLKKEIVKTIKRQEEFIIKNLNLIEYVANYYGDETDKEDLLQEGYFGMIEAIKKYDITQTTNFPFFAIIYIKKYILDYLKKTISIVKMPQNLLMDVKNFTKAEEKLTNTLLRKPTIKELKEETKFSKEQIKDITFFKAYCENPLSIDNIANEENDIFLSSLIPTDNGELINDINYTLFYEYIKRKILELNIDNKTKQIIIMRFGIKDGKPKSLKEISKITGLNEVYLRKIEATSLRIIRDYFSNQNKTNQNEKIYIIKPKIKYPQINRENKTIIKQNIRFLDNTSLVILILYYKFNMDIKTISSKLNISEKDIQIIMEIASKKLSQNIKYKKERKRKKIKTIRK